MNNELMKTELEVAKAGKKLVKLMKLIQSRTGVNDINQLGEWAAAELGVERAYVVQAVKYYFEFRKLNPDENI